MMLIKGIIGTIAVFAASLFTTGWSQADTDERIPNRLAMQIESVFPGSLQLLETYQRAINECDDTLFAQSIHEESWIIGFPMPHPRTMGGNSAFFDDLCSSGTLFNVTVSPPSGLYFADGYILVVQIAGEIIRPEADPVEVDENVSLYVTENDDGQPMIIFSHSSPFPRD